MVDVSIQKGRKYQKENIRPLHTKVKKSSITHTAIISPNFHGQKKFLHITGRLQDKIWFCEDYDLYDEARQKYQMTNIHRSCWSGGFQDNRNLDLNGKNGRGGPGIKLIH